MVRGLQLALGLQLARLAVVEYIVPGGLFSLGLVGCCGVLLFALRKAYLNGAPMVSIAFRLPTPVVPSIEEIKQGALLLALPQLPLSISNSIIATARTAADLFPDRRVAPRALGLTYGLANLIAAPLGDVPVYHGSGALVGMHVFGARTGGAPIVCGATYLLLGLACSDVFLRVARSVLPPVYGALLFAEALGLIALLRDLITDPLPLGIAIIVGFVAALVPHGYAVSVGVGLAASVVFGRQHQR